MMSGGKGTPVKIFGQEFSWGDRAAGLDCADFLKTSHIWGVVRWNEEK